jgi:serine/threonine protein kinase
VSRSAPEVGSTASSYEILAKLAEGGMAEIFLARGASVGGVARYVVLKRILRERATDVQLVRMFLDEARLAAQLQHPNIAQVYDVGKLGDSYFFTMEYVHGETVREIMRRAHALDRRLPFANVLAIATGAASGLHHAHDRIGVDGRHLGIVHRDVSPSNLMVSFEGTVKVVDFGVAKAADRLQETRSGTVKGKISYLSPEQCQCRVLDRRSDLFSLGIVLWELLTLERLYKRASDFDNMTAIVGESPPAPSSRRRDVPPELDALVLRLLAKRPEDRFQSGDDLVAAIETVAVALGAVPTASGLSRVLRDMFGPQPEPWIELDSGDAPRPISVASEPIPDELVHTMTSSVDLQLAEIRERGSPTSRRFAAPLLGAVDPLAILTPLTTLRAIPPSESVPPVLAHRPTPSPFGNAPFPTARGRSRWWIVVLVVVALGSVVGVIAVMSPGGSRDDAPPLARATPDAGTAIVIDAAAIAISASDAAPAAIEIASDAAVAATITEVPAQPPVGPPPVTAKTKRPSPSKADPIDDIRRAYETGKYTRAVAACIAAANLADVVSECALAACRIHDELHARRWLQQGVSASAVTACKRVGISLDASPRRVDAGVDCESNPMDCQHL